MRPERDLIVSICIAYEQGYGKGLHNTRDIDNPYVESPEKVAWGFGYSEGRSKQKQCEANKNG